MQETNLINDYFEQLKIEWEKLNSSEKAIVKNYVRMIKKEIKPSNSIIHEVNNIHKKHPDFHVGCVP